MTPSFLRNDVKCHVAAGATPTFIANRGFSGVVQVAAGQYRLTLAEKIPASAMVVQATPDAPKTFKPGASAEVVSDATIDVFTWDAHLAPEDQIVNFFLTVERVGF